MTNLTAPVYGVEHANAWTGIVGPSCTRITSNLKSSSGLRWKNFSPAKAQRRKENPFETRQRFAPLRPCGRKLRIEIFTGLLLWLDF